MKNKLTETKFKSVLGVAGKLFTSVACLGAVILICASASAQNLFVTATDVSTGTPIGTIYQFAAGGVQSTFASGLNGVGGLAFDSTGNLFVADSTVGVNGSLNTTIYKFTANGVQSTFAVGLHGVGGLAFDSADNLFVADNTGGLGGSINSTIYEFTPGGVQSTFAVGLSFPGPLAFDSAGNLFVADDTGGSGKILKFTAAGVQTIFASGFFNKPTGVACDSQGNVFVGIWGTGVVRNGMGDGYIVKFAPSGVSTRFASGLNGPLALACDSAGNLFVQDASATDPSETHYYPGAIYEFTPTGVRGTFAPGFDKGNALAFQPNENFTPPPTPSVATPMVSPNGGKFRRRVIVTLTDDTPGVAIYYTLDGSDPTTSSIPYQGAFVLRRSATVKTIAVDSSLNQSGISTASFRIKRR